VLDTSASVDGLPDGYRLDAPGFRGPAVLDQEWRDVTFLHWRVEPAAVAGLLPPGVRPDVLDGATYVGLIGFRMHRLGPGGGGLALPWLGEFPELNVRLYSVDDAGRHGVVFRSLEASRLGAVLGARAVYGLPYTWARMTEAYEDGVLALRSRRRWPTRGAASARIAVRPGAPLERPTPLDHFLTARWGLHHVLLGRPVWIPNRHAAWRLHDAELVALQDGLVAAAGVAIDGAPDVAVRFSPGVRTQFGLPQRL
jgi:uncharacterized protein